MSKSPIVIEVHLQTAEQLFNSLDPSPFHERDLDDAAERYIAGWARETRGAGPLQVVVTLPEGAHNSEGARRIPEAIHNYFSNRAVQARQELHELLRIGWRSLAIGLLVLLLCFVAIQYMSTATSETTVGRLMEQSLLILGWVANWRPLEIFLYDWLPIRRHFLLFKRLAEMPVEVRTASSKL